MPNNSVGRWYYSLRTTLLAALVGLQLVFLFVALGGLDVFLGRFFQQVATSQASLVGQTIKTGLRQQMLRTPDTGVESSLEDLRQVKDLHRVWIIDKTGRIAYATDRAMVGRVLDRQTAPACIVCHTASGVRATQTSFAADDSSVPVIRYVDILANERACQGCHDPKQRINGIVLVEQSTSAFRGALSTIRNRLAMTGGATLVALVGATFLAMTLLVLVPVRRLMIGVARVGSGDLAARIPVVGRGELAELASAFNAMTGDLERHVEEIRNKTAELSVVYAILGQLTKSIQLSELRDIVLLAFLQVFGADHAVLLSRGDGEPAAEAASRGRDEVRTRRIRPDEGGDLILPPGFPDEVVQRWSRGELRGACITEDRHVVVLPVETALKTKILLLIRRDAPLTEPETNATLLAVVAEHVGVAFNNAELYSQAITDELTRLFTVRHFYNQLEDCIARQAREGRLFCLLIIDLDRFKQINDTRGHLAGDAVLRDVAAILRNSVRLPDSSYRYGGDEMTVLLPDAGLAAGLEVGERIRRGIESMRTTVAEGEVLQITATIGVAACPEHGTTSLGLVAAADAALYAAKSAGRNRVVAAQPST